MKASAPPEPYSEAQGSTPPPCWFVYLLRCADGSLYCGASSDAARRVAEHNRGRGSMCVRGRLPAELVYTEACPDRGAALRREAAIKKLTRAEKLALIAAQSKS